MACGYVQRSEPLIFRFLWLAQQIFIFCPGNVLFPMFESGLRGRIRTDLGRKNWLKVNFRKICKCSDKGPNCKNRWFWSVTNNCKGWLWTEKTFQIRFKISGTLYCPRNCSRSFQTIDGRWCLEFWHSHLWNFIIW